jgi:hypothetical protein
VEYIGPVRKHLLTTYRRRADFQRAVERGDYDYIVVQEISSLDASLPQRQEKWLEEMGYKEILAGTQTFFGGAPLRVYQP